MKLSRQLCYTGVMHTTRYVNMYANSYNKEYNEENEESINIRKSVLIQ